MIKWRGLRHQRKIEMTMHNHRRAISNGFTLTELLIALGILAVGVSMAASLFPTAIQFRQASVNDSLGTLICRNALAIVQAKLTHAASPFTGPTLTYADLGNDSLYARDVNVTRGFLTLGRRVTSGKNDYQIVVIAYSKNAGGTVTPAPITGVTIAESGNVSTATFASNPSLLPGSPVILSSSGLWGKIKTINGNIATLDRRVPVTGGTYDVYVMSESGATRSQAINVLVTRTSLP